MHIEGFRFYVPNYLPEVTDLSIYYMCLYGHVCVLLFLLLCDYYHIANNF